jgi:hypothetical protein
LPKNHTAKKLCIAMRIKYRYFNAFSFLEYYGFVSSTKFKCNDGASVARGAG